MRKRRDSEAGVEFGGDLARLTPVDVQQQQFRRSFRGDDEQEVDDFLDRVTEALSALVEEKRALEEGRGGALAPSPDVGQGADASRAADEIKRNAREQADAIVRDAQARAGAIRRDAESRAAASRGEAPETGAGAAAGTAGLSAFVAREREFLQRLAGLVQGHAEGVKEMVQAARRSQAPAPSAPASSAPTSSAPPTPPEPAIPPAPPGPPAPGGFGLPPEPERPAWQSEGGPAIEAAAPEPESPGSAVLRVPEADAEGDQERGAAIEAGIAGPGAAPDEAPRSATVDAPRPAPVEASPRWSPPEPPRLPDLPAPPGEASLPHVDARPVGDARSVERPVPVPRGPAARGAPEEDEPEGEREATLRELFWGED